MPHLSDIESCYHGGPEIRFNGVVWNASFTTAVDAYGKMQYPSRNAAKDGYNPSQNLFKGYFDDNHGPDNYAKTFKIDDDGTTLSFNVGVTAGCKDTIQGMASFGISYKAQDKPLASELIQHSSQIPKTISDSNIIYTITQ